jgi:RND family efflux transporter MFP subunit
MTGKKRFFTISVLIIIALLAAFIAADAEEQGKVETTSDIVSSVPIEVMTVATQDLPVIVETVGRINPDREVVVSAQISGQIKGYEVDVGDRITAGQLLVQIDPTDYKLALEQARSNLSAAEIHLSTAQKAFNRFQKLLPKKVISQDNFEKVEAEYWAAQAQKDQAEVGVKIARERLKKAGITAPFAGIVARRDVETGQWIAAGMPVMTIVDLRKVRAKVFLNEKDFVHIDSGDPVEIIAEAYPDQRFTGSIGRIDIEADPMTNTFGVEIIAENPATILKAGMSARVYITTLLLKNIILIPQNVIIFRERGIEVFVVDDDETALTREVKLGRTSGNLIQVIEGLRAGDRLIVKGQNYVKPGEKVTVLSSRQ